MEIASDTTKIRLAAFQLEGEAQVWWNWEKTSRDLEAMTWAEFHDLFMGQVFSGYCSSREGSGVPRTEAGDYDRIEVCG